MLFALFVLFSTLTSAVWQNQKYFDNTQCNGSPLLVSSSNVTTCVAVSCTFNSGNFYSSITCDAAQVSAGAVSSTQYSITPGGTLSCASASATSPTAANGVSFITNVLTGAYPGGCLNSSTVTQLASTRISCNSTGYTSILYSGSATCGGTGTTSSGLFPPTCSVASGTSVTITNNPCPYGGAACFHKDTVIEYEGRTLDLDKVRTGENPDCRIPHTVWRIGITIKTSCTVNNLRLTADHLVFTHRGMLQAGEIRPGDVLFADLAETKPCHVLVASIEPTPQEYIGLNCRISVVLASGLKTSTFGRLHTLPAFWMQYVSLIFGAHRASTWGDYLASIWV